MSDVRERGANPLERGSVNRIKPIGIIGGRGTQATEDIKRRFQRETLQSFPHGLATITYEFPDTWIELNDDRSIPDILKPSKGLLAAAQEVGSRCSLLLLTAHTPELFLGELKRASGGVEFVSMADATLDEVLRRRDANGLERAGVVGHSVTIRGGLYQQRLEELGIDHLALSDGQSHDLDRAIDGFTEDGLPLYDLAFETQGACTSLLRRGAQAIILACTELPLCLDLFKGIPRGALINPNQLLAEAAAKKALSLMQQAR